MLDAEVFKKKVAKSIDVIKARVCISRLLVGLSGGKDSLCICELVKMAEATNVRYFNMEFLPNLQVQYDMLQYACHRFNIPYEQIIKVPSEHFIKCMHFCAFTWYSQQAQKDFPDITRKQVYASIAKENQGTIVTGVKKSDGIMMMRKVDGNHSNELFPIKDWTLEDVLCLTLSLTLRYEMAKYCSARIGQARFKGRRIGRWLFMFYTRTLS